MKIEVKEVKSNAQDIQCVFMDAFEMGRRAALKSWGDE